jgi:hypothetical protein
MAPEHPEKRITLYRVYVNEAYVHTIMEQLDHPGGGRTTRFVIYAIDELRDFLRSKGEDLRLWEELSDPGKSRLVYADLRDVQNATYVKLRFG